jgi:hypothetical protein
MTGQPEDTLALVLAIIAPEADSSLTRVIAKAFRYVELRAETAERKVDELSEELARLKQVKEPCRP